MSKTRLTYSVRLCICILCTIMVASGVGAVNWWADPTGTTNYGGYYGWLKWVSSVGKYHLAQDMISSVGAPIYSIGDGDILAAASINGYGNPYGGCVVIRYYARDGSPFTALYGSLQNYLTSGHVTRGQVIGYTCPYSGGNNLHFAIHPGDWLASDADRYRGWTTSTSNTYGYTNPIDYLNAHSYNYADVWWTGLPANDRWYRSNERLTYSWNGSDVNVDEGPRAGGLGELYMAEAGCGHNRYWARAWNGGRDYTIDWWGYFDNQVPGLGWNGDTAPGGTWLRGTQYARWHWSDAHSGVRYGWYRWNGGATSDGGSGNAQLLEGKNTLQIYVEDNAWTGGSQSGNSSSISAEFWLDNGVPALPVTAPLTSVWFNTAKTLSWNASDTNSGISSVTLRWDAGAPKNVPATGTEPIPEGIHNVTIVATDVAGNPKTSTSGPYWIDLTAPSIPQSHAGAATSYAAVALTWSASTDNLELKGYNVYRDGILLGFVTSTQFSDTGLTPSTSYTYTIKSLDAAGNASAASAPVPVKTLDLPIGIAKTRPDEAQVALENKVVSAVYSDAFYVMDPHTAGIRVECPGTILQVGDLVRVDGIMRTNPEFERYIEISEVIPPTGSAQAAADYVGNRYLGGDSTNEYDPATGAGQRGVEDADGPIPGTNNIGLLMKTSGKVTIVGSDWFYIDDGSHATDFSIFNGIRVRCGALTKPTSGQQVFVTGISSIIKVNDRLFRSIRPRTQEDILIPE